MSTPRRPTLGERVLDRVTRRAALEECLIARLLLTPRAIERVGPIPVSPACALVLQIIVDEPIRARVDFGQTLRDELTIRHTDDGTRETALALARAAARLTAAELTEIGSLRTLVALLDESAPVVLPTGNRKAA